MPNTAKATSVRDAILGAGLTLAAVAGHHVITRNDVTELVHRPRAEVTDSEIVDPLLDLADAHGELPDDVEVCCNLGAVSNHPSRIYCQGGTFGALTDATDLDGYCGTIDRVGRRVYESQAVTGQAAAARMEAEQ